MANKIKTTCPYCGVGCGVEIEQTVAGPVVSGDPDHPSNFGRLCSKGSALAETVDLEGRLLDPKVNGQTVSWDVALEKVASGFNKVIAEHGPDAVAFYGSGQLLTEDYYVANKLMKGFIGSANIDTNSRLCMASSVVGHKRAFGADTVPCSYEDLERAKLIVLVGSNTAWCHPVLYQRIVKAKKANPDLMVVVIDPRKTDTGDIADLYLTLRSGTDAVLFNGLLNYLHQQQEANALYINSFTQGFEEALAAAQESASDLDSVARVTGIEYEMVEQFYRLFARTERVITVYSQGINQSSSGSDKVNAIINCHLATGRIGRPGMGPFSFTGQPNAMGGREVGGLANQLAAHMDLENEEHRDLVKDFWRSPTIASKPGLKAVDLFNAIEEGKIKALWIMATNPLVSLPDADSVKAALQKCELVVVSDCMAKTDTTIHAHVKLPALTWGEKDGTVTNSERRISRQRAFLKAPGEAKPDWWIVSEVAKRMGFEDAFNYQHHYEVFNEHAALSGFNNAGSRDFDISWMIAENEAQYHEIKPIQWPVNEKNPNGTSRMFGDGQFYTPDKKARLLPVIPKLPENAPSADFPLILNTGRIRDQWHTMTRTAKSARLSTHRPEPLIEIHSRDAAKEGIKDGELARVFSRWGEMIGRVAVNDQQQQGMLFAPMHWNDQTASQARVGAVINPVCDPFSGQPELKHTPVRIQPLGNNWSGFILSRRKLNLDGMSYWVRATGEGYYRYEIACDQLAEDWPAWARGYLCSSSNDVNWLEYLDIGKHRYRGVRMIGDQVESCIFISSLDDLPSRSWLAGLFDKPSLTKEERQALLTGKPPVGQKDTGKTICACFNVGENSIRDAIQEGADSVEAIGKCLGAGTGCGSCVPEIRAMLQG